MSLRFRLPKARVPLAQRALDWILLSLGTALGVRGWLAPGYLASPRLEMVPELSIIWMMKQRLLEGGSLAEWVPFEFGGFPLVRYLSYPLYDGLAALSIVTGLGLEWIYKAAFVAAFVLSGITFYEYARVLTKRRGAAVVAGTIYALLPFHLHVASEAWVHAVFWAVLPLLFLVYEQSRLGRRPSGQQAMIMGVLLASLPIINSEHTLLVAPFLGAYVLLRDGRALWRGTLGWLEALKYWGLAGVVAAGLACFFVLPGLLELEYVGIHLKHGAESFQSNELLRDYAVSPALVWRAILRRFGLSYEMATPSVIGRAFWSITWYPGLIALGLLGLGIMRSWREARFRAHLALLALAIVFVLGGWLPWNPIPRLPFLGRLVPFRNMIFVGFFGAACAAWGATGLLERVRLPAWGISGALLLLVLGDYWAATGGLRSLPGYFPADEMAAYRWLGEQSDEFRTWETMTTHRDAYLRSYGLIYDNRRHAWGYYDNGAPRHMWALYSWGDLSTALGLSSTRYVLTRPQASSSSKDGDLIKELGASGYDRMAWESEHLTIWENPGWQPMVRAYGESAFYLGDPEYRALDILPAMVEQGIALASGRADYADDYTADELALFDYLVVREPWSREDRAAESLSRSFGNRIVSHQEILRGIRPARGKDVDARISWTRSGPEEIQVSILAQDPALVMVSEGWYPNWRVKIDGQEGRVWRVNYAFLGAQVPAGEHLLVFRYVKPWYVWVGYGVTIVTAVAVLVAWIAGRRRDHSQREAVASDSGL